MTLSVRNILLINIVFLSLPSYGSDTISWNDCLQKTRENNPDVKAAKEQLESTRSTYKSTYSGFLPEVNASAGYTKSQTNNVDKKNYTLGLNVTQNIFSGFRSYYSMEEASANVNSVDAKLASVLADVSYELKKNYAEMIYAQQSITLEKEILKRREENLKLVELRFSSGRENKGAVLLSKAYHQQAKYDELTASNNFVVVRSQFAKTLYLEQDENFTVKEDISLSSPEEKLDLNMLIAQNPTEKQNLADEESSLAAIGVARSKFYPSLDFTGSVNKVGEKFAPENKNWAIGVNLTLPLFEGGNSYYSLQSAKHNYYKAQYSRRSSNKNLVALIQQAHAAYREAIEKFKVDQSFLDAALVRAEIARNKYNNGLMTFDDWDVIESDLIAREKAVLQSKKARIVAEASYEQVLGKGSL